MRSRRVLLPLAAAALAVAGCSAQGPPEVTFYADGESVHATPLIHCDALVRDCERGDGPARLTVRPGEPVQLSVPSEVAETPWAVNVQYLDANGQPQPVRQEVFTAGDQHAYTATTNAPGEQLLVVEVQQLGAAYAADQAGNPILDAAGNPQLVIRAVWSLQIDPA